MTTFQLILLAFAIALDPLPLSAYILLLGSKGGVRKGLGFTLGWCLSLAIISFVVIEVTGKAPPKSKSAPSTVLLIIEIIAGLVLLWLAWRQRSRARKPKPEPKWQKNLDKLGFFAAMGIAWFLQPWVAIGAGAATVSQSDKAVAVALFGIVASSSYLTMTAFSLIKPEATNERLQGLMQWLDDHHNAAVIVLYVFVGIFLITTATTALV